MALVLNERFVGRGLLRSIVLVPWAMAPVSVGVLWSFLFAGEFGALNGLLNDLGLGARDPWLGNGFRALNLVALVHVWNQAPLTALMLLAGLQSMPEACTARRCSTARGRCALLQHHAALAEADPAVHLHHHHHQFADGIRHALDDDARRPGRATTVLSWIGYLMSFQFFRFGEGAASRTCSRR